MQNKDYPKLLNCPFCGGEARMIPLIGYHTSYGVECENEDCPGHHINQTWGTLDEAITAWNSRTAPENKPLTLFDRVTENFEMLAKFIQQTFIDGVEHGVSKIDFGTKQGSVLYWIDWLNQPEQEDKQ
ncbi:Lar family restriction alleviation protein [Scatolibacter rhodanostii]|uniref:Lar family restriction alleviation protein n=1 Tax=Scatolibacter rhodanostii TaxID=2014781 RepID=UPI000C068FBF|nr:Lar family restriction alleviation protein [Scatolibacter rhodanostii]